MPHSKNKLYYFFYLMFCVISDMFSIRCDKEFCVFFDKILSLLIKKKNKKRPIVKIFPVAIKNLYLSFRQLVKSPHCRKMVSVTNDFRMFSSVLKCKQSFSANELLHRFSSMQLGVVIQQDDFETSVASKWSLLLALHISRPIGTWSVAKIEFIAKFLVPSFAC